MPKKISELPAVSPLLGTAQMEVNAAGAAPSSRTTAQEVADLGNLTANAAGRARMGALFFDVATVDAKIATDAIGEDRLTPGELTGRVMANVATGNVAGGVPVVFDFTIPDAAGNVDIITTHKIRVIDMVLVKTGAGFAGNTGQLFNGAAAISDAMDLFQADKKVMRAGTWDVAAWEVAAGGTLRFTTVRGGASVACRVFVTAVRIA